MLKEKISSLPLPNFLNLKNILLVGAGGLTGKFYTQLLLAQGKKVFAYDHQANSPTISLHENFVWVNHEQLANFSILTLVDAVTLSPGVPLQQEIFEKAFEKKIPIFSELEFSLAFLKNPIIAITGTDGKSTVTSLITHLFHSHQQTAIACGNYGIPFSALVLQKKKEILVAELSSYQLELCRNLQTEVALFLNISHDHLNRYLNFKDYSLTKWKIALHVRKLDNFLLSNKILSKDFPWTKEFLLKNFKENENFLQIDENKLESKDFFWQEQECYWKENSQSIKKIIHTNDLPIKGKHNQINVLFALQAFYNFQKSFLFDIPKDFYRKLSLYLKNFAPLAHRFELVPSTDGNMYINDSKATTTQAVITALENVSSPLYVFLGGKGKGESYQCLANLLHEKQAKVILFGQAAMQMKVDLQNKVNIIAIKENLQQAFDFAQKDYRQKEIATPVTFLLSPAATSWDAFDSFEHRGNFFKKLVQEITT